MSGGMDEPILLLKLINGGDSRPFDELISEFKSKVQPSRIFAFCCTVATLVTESKLLRPTQRLVGFAILHQAYSSQQPSSNPFSRVLVNAASNEEAENLERVFILQLLGFTSSTNVAEVLKLSAADYMKNFDSSLHTFPPREQLQQRYCTEVGPEPFGSFFRNRMMNILPDPDVPQGCDINSTEFDLQPGVIPKIGSGARDETISGLLQNLSLEALGSQWVRPRPPMLPVLEQELMWLNPDYTHELMWDGGMCVAKAEPAKRSTVEDLTVTDLITNGLEGPLEPAEEEQVLLGLGDKPPQPATELSELVKNNPKIAAEFLIKLKDLREIWKYYGELFSMKVDFNLIEVVNELNKAVELDTEFQEMWIQCGLIFWENIKDEDPQIAFDSLFKLAEFPCIKKRVDSAMIERPWDKIKGGDPRIAFDYLFKLAEFPCIKESVDSDMIKRPWDSIKVGDPRIAFGYLFELAEFPRIKESVDSDMIKRPWDSIKVGDPRRAFEYLFKLAEFPRVKESADSDMIKMPWDSIKVGDPRRAFDYLFKLAEFPCIKESVDSDMIKRPWDSIKVGDPQRAFDSLFKLAEFPRIKESVDSDMIKRPWDSIKVGDPRRAFDSLFKLAEFPRIKESVDSDMIKRPWDSIKVGDPQIVFDSLFKLAEFPRIKEQSIRLVDDSYIQHFIKSCNAFQPQSKDMHPPAAFLVDFLKKLIQGGVIKGTIYPSPR